MFLLLNTKDNLMKKLLFHFTFLLLSVNLTGQWNSNPAINNAISTTSGNQVNPRIVSNGTNGAVIVWQDNRNGNNDIFAQQINADGEIQWTSDGLPVTTASGSQSGPQIINAGNGYYIITWLDSRNGNNDIYAQKINSMGVVQWAEDVAVCTAPLLQASPQIVSDDNGGAIIVWQDQRDGLSDIYAQKIDADGNILWDLNGIPICVAPNEQNTVQIIKDGDGGAIMVWADNRNNDGINNNSDIYAQRVDANGTMLWLDEGVNGIAVAQSEEIEYAPQLTTDGIDGTIITWVRATDATNGDIYAQYINGLGLPLWATDGIVVCDAVNNQVSPQIITGVNDVFIVWEDSRGGIDKDIYAQRIDFGGSAIWAANGIIVCNVIADQTTPKLINDEDKTGIFVTWTDARDGATSNIYAQHLDATGLGVLTANGTLVCSAQNIQISPQPVLSENDAIITWQDLRNGNYDIYASRVGALSSLPVTGLVLYGKQNDNVNELYWTTITEHNNKGFAIERSNDGISFIEIGFVAGAGNSSEMKSYTFTDQAPGLNRNFYRIKQIDYDGKFNYSSAILIQPSSGKNAAAVYPNPVTNNINVTVQLVNRDKLTWQLIDVSGKNLKTGKWDLSAGTIALPAIDITIYSSGIYYLKITGSSFSKMIKLVKL